ncbi:hypothetical protein AbraIFM66951_011287 [Aspergillus brasiliensis]|uniref:DUF7770 domain-containing protein n=1 Tax=Aspergillus brasiliensis TaxID=319629 RepID=A0A9W5YNT3_9EURO|nr:hypothetical protein AbraCBS73388_004380 [Aspergillus brasiliensis]GKZ47723.1 hypothetical protein AbraIFM66951_011287 [Aspergillus brasiliensis]
MSSERMQCVPADLLDMTAHFTIKRLKLCATNPQNLDDRIGDTNIHLQTNTWNLRIQANNSPDPDNTDDMVRMAMNLGPEHTGVPDSFIQIKVFDENNGAYATDRSYVAPDHIAKRVLMRPVGLTIQRLLEIIREENLDMYVYTGQHEHQETRYWFKVLVDKMAHHGNINGTEYTNARNALSTVWEDQHNRVNLAVVASPLRGTIRNPPAGVNGVNGINGVNGANGVDGLDGVNGH